MGLAEADVHQLLDQTLRTLNDVSDGDALCTVRGEKVAATKYYEGQVVALKNLIRHLRRHPDGSKAQDVVREWDTATRHADTGSPAWRSYRLGGQDILDRLFQ